MKFFFSVEKCYQMTVGYRWFTLDETVDLYQSLFLKTGLSHLLVYLT